MSHANSSSGPVRRTILALDGGGVRGAISVAFLERIEALLAEEAAPGAEPPRLADVFHLVGGTSTGAIIAGALALGYRARDLRDFYLKLAPKIFRRSVWRVPGLRTAFDARPLEREIANVVGERTLDSADLKTFLAVVTKRMDTASAWLITNNPNGKWWEDGPGYLGNRHYKLKNLVRASSAAPHYFAPEAIPVMAGQPPGLFVDGGVTAYNNPALLLAMVATIPDYGFGWAAGADRLALVSIGTGAYRARLEPASARRLSPLGLALRALSGTIADVEIQTVALCQWLGQSETRWRINEEIGDLSTAPMPAAPLFRFFRYNVRLEAKWLAEEVGLRFAEADLARLHRLDEAPAAQLLYEIGTAAAERFVRPEHVRLLLRRGGQASA